MVEHPSDKGKAESSILSARTMATLIFGIGIPGSGKTTILKKIAEENSFTYISPDSIRLAKLGSEIDHSTDKEIWRIARTRAASALEAGQIVVFDSTFSNKDRRVRFIKAAREWGATAIEGLFFDLLLDEVLKRNTARGDGGDKRVSDEYLQQAYAELVQCPPAPEEGFDALVHMDKDGHKTEMRTIQGSILLKHLL